MVSEVALDPISRKRPLNIMLIISSLEFGGAERQVIELASSLDRTQFNPSIVSLSNAVPLAARLPDRENLLTIIEKQSRFDFSTIFRVARLMKRKRIDLVHAFLFDAEIVARLAGKLAGVTVTLGSERNSDYKRKRIHQLALLATSPLAKGVIANSRAGKRFYSRTLPFDRNRVCVVHNGIDTKRFKPDRESGLPIRAKQGIPSNAPVVGIVASFKRQKRHQDFLHMAKRVSEKRPNVHFLLAGEPLRDNQQGAADYHREIRSLLNQLNLSERCHFLGNCSEIEKVYNTCDVKVLCSSREGTPNVLLEAMACGVPVVATDIADNAFIVENGKSGYIVPLGDISQLAAKTSSLIEAPSLRQRMGQSARETILANYSLEALARKIGHAYGRAHLSSSTL